MADPLDAHRGIQGIVLDPKDAMQDEEHPFPACTCATSVGPCPVHPGIAPTPYEVVIHLTAGPLCQEIALSFDCRDRALRFAAGFGGGYACADQESGTAIYYPAHRIAALEVRPAAEAGQGRIGP